MKRLLVLLVIVTISATLVAGSLASAQAKSKHVSCTWSACASDARWLRSVLARIQLGPAGSTGSALTVRFSGKSGTLSYLWATPGTQIAAPFKLRVRIGNVGVYSDGTRVVWRAQGTRVWLEPIASKHVIARLVRASLVVRRP